MAITSSFADGLRLTLIAMGIVFAALFALSALMGALGKFFGREQKPKTKPVAQPIVEKVETAVVEESKPGMSPQLVAVIATALAAYLGQAPENLNIVSINRVPTGISQWSMAARRESIQN